jgi:uncharacterized protein
MTKSHEPLTTAADESVVRRGFEAFGTGDLQALADVLSSDVVWHVAGDNAVSGLYQGRDATFALFATLAELTGGTYRVEPDAITSDGDQVVARLRSLAQRGSKSLDAWLTIRFTIAHGQVVETLETVDDPSAWDQFWA